MTKKELLEPMKSALNDWQGIKCEGFTNLIDLIKYAKEKHCACGICHYLEHNYDDNISDLFFATYCEQFGGYYLTTVISFSGSISKAMETVDFRINWLKKEIELIEQMP